MFHYSNSNIVQFLCYAKNYSKILRVSINTYEFYYILLNINIDFLFYGYICYLMSKNTLTPPTY